MCTRLQDRRNNVWCFCVSTQATKEGRAPPALPPASSALSHPADTPTVQSPMFPAGNIWERLGTFRYKSKQPASWSRKATRLNPWSPSWYQIPLFHEVRRTSHSLSKKEVAVSQQLSELKDWHNRAGHKKLVQLPSTQDYSELDPSRKVPLGRGWKLFQGRGGKSLLLALLDVPLTGWLSLGQSWSTKHILFLILLDYPWEKNSNQIFNTKDEQPLG